MKTILTKVPDENMYFDFEDFNSYVDFDKERLIICGNSHFRNIGDEKLISIVEGTYYDDEVGYDYETLEMLKKVTGKDWTETTLRGYSQGDWQTLYYVVDDSTIEELEMIETFYMGKVTEFKVDEGPRAGTTAEGLAMIKAVGMDEAVLKLRGLEAFEKIADGQATKIIIPSNLQDMSGLVTSISELAKK